VEASSQGLRLCKDVPSPICAAWLRSVEYILKGKGVQRRTPFLIAPKREEILERLLFL
jgi:hypothetical protein